MKIPSVRNIAFEIDTVYIIYGQLEDIRCKYRTRAVFFGNYRDFLDNYRDILKMNSVVVVRDFISNLYIRTMKDGRGEIMVVT